MTIKRPKSIADRIEALKLAERLHDQEAGEIRAAIKLRAAHRESAHSLWQRIKRWFA